MLFPPKKLFDIIYIRPNGTLVARYFDQEKFVLLDFSTVTLIHPIQCKIIVFVFKTRKKYCGKEPINLKKIRTKAINGYKKLIIHHQI